jgi:hypothetical protein
LQLRIGQEANNRSRQRCDMNLQYGRRGPPAAARHSTTGSRIRIRIRIASAATEDSAPERKRRPTRILRDARAAPTLCCGCGGPWRLRAACATALPGSRHTGTIFPQNSHPTFAESLTMRWPARTGGSDPKCKGCLKTRSNARPRICSYSR